MDISLESWWSILLTISGIIEVAWGLPREINIGGIFEHEFRGQEMVFKYAVEKVNSRRDILPYTKLTYDIQECPADDSFLAAKKVCRQMKDGVAAIFGPMSGLSASHVQSICDAMEIPHVETRWDFRENIDFYSINLYPYYRTLSKAYIDLIATWEWNSFTILYETNEGLIRLQELLKSPPTEDDTKKNKFKLTVRRLEAMDGTDFRPILKELKNRGESKIVLDCPWHMVYEVLKQAQSINMMSQYYHYLLTTLDLDLLDLEEFKFGGANITAFRLVDLNTPMVREVMRDWSREEETTGLSPLENSRGFRTETALMYDAVHLFAKALDEVSRAQEIALTPLSCNKAKPWDQGNSLLNYMKMTEIDGLTGKVKYDNMGRRAYFSLDLIELTMTGLQKIGMWNPRDGINITKDYSETVVEVADSLKNKTLVVTTILEDPYMMLAEDPGPNGPREGNDRFEGYCVDLLAEIAKIRKFKYEIRLVSDDQYGSQNDEGEWTGMVRELMDRFNYTIRLVADGKYGSPEGPKQEWTGMVRELIDRFNYKIQLVGDGQYGAKTGPNGEWTGMVRELMDRKADLAVASLTISYVREQVIDFTKPFMNLGISIIFRRPEKKNPSLFSFLSPLSFEIWIYMLAAYLIVSFMLFVLARFTPYEWYNPNPCNPDSDVVENQFSLLNSLWFNIGSLMQQGSEVAPRAVSTRIVSGIWWFFTLIMISSYTANLAAFLTVERMTSPIENADDLSKQTEIKYGTVYGGSTMTFFKTSKIPTYERMWNFMSSHKPSVFVNNTKEGIERVKKGKYAYLLESTMNEYITQRNCELMQVGGLLDSKGYGIGTPQGSPYRDLISEAILKLQEDQILQMLYNKWWKQKGTQTCESDEGKKDASALAIANVGGVFVVLVAGLLLGLIVAFIEFIYKAHKNADIDRQPLCTEILEELRFAVSCCGKSTKPATKKRQDTPDYYMDGNGTTLMPLNTNYAPRPIGFKEEFIH